MKNRFKDCISCALLKPKNEIQKQICRSCIHANNFEPKVTKIWRIQYNTEEASVHTCMILAENEKEAWRIFAMNDENDSEDLSIEIEDGWYDIEEITDMSPRILFSSVMVD